MVVVVVNVLVVVVAVVDGAVSVAIDVDGVGVDDGVVCGGGSGGGDGGGGGGGGVVVDTALSTSQVLHVTGHPLRCPLHNAATDLLSTLQLGLSGTPLHVLGCRPPLSTAALTAHP